MLPLVAAAHTSLPSGLNATANTSHPGSMGSMQSFLYTSHSFIVPSHDPEAMQGVRRSEEKGCRCCGGVEDMDGGCEERREGGCRA